MNDILVNKETEKENIIAITEHGSFILTICLLVCELKVLRSV